MTTLIAHCASNEIDTVVEWILVGILAAMIAALFLFVAWLIWDDLVA